MRTALNLFIFIICTNFVFTQCGGDISLSTWTQEGPAATGVWTVGGGGNNVFQTINGEPTFFVSPNNYINVKIKGKFNVQSGRTTDDDFIGFVFGYQSPNTGTVSGDCDFYVFDWKQQFQLENGYLGEEGFSVAKVDTNIDLSSIVGNRSLFWDRENKGNGYKMLGTNFGVGLGWEYDSTYNFELTYTYSQILITIDSDTIFNINGCFEPGRFGFYNYSQQDVTYSDFSYELVYNFTVPPTVTCLGDSSYFTAVSDTCPSALSDNSIANWQWSFGDGNTSTNANGVNFYNSPGLYPVELIVEDVNGCKDTTNQVITIQPRPAFFSLGADSEHCFDDGPFVIDAGNWSSYLWQDNWNGRYYSTSQQGLFSITITDQNGCSISDQVQINEFCPAELSVPNVMSPNGDNINDSLKYTYKHIYKFDFSIYNRWGTLLFKTDDLTEFWDGRTDKGNKVNEGVYYWIANYWDRRDQKFEQKGNVTIFK